MAATKPAATPVDQPADATPADQPADAPQVDQPADATPADQPADAPQVDQPADATPAEPVLTTDPSATPGVDAGIASTDTGFADSLPEGDEDVTVTVVVQVSGLRNGEPWPAAGEPFTLPAAEAADYIKLGLVKAE